MSFKRTSGLLIPFLATGLWSLTAWAEQIVPQAEAVSRVTQTLQDALTGLQDGFVVDGVTLPHDLKLPDGAVSWQVELPPGTMQPGRYTLPVTVVVNGETAMTVKANLHIQQRMTLPAAKANLPKGHIIGPDDLQWLEYQADRPLVNPVRDGTDLMGKETLRPVRPNTPLLQSWFAEPLAVNQGEKVRILLDKGGLSIETRAIAMGKGRVGDEIVVRNPESSRRYRARITGPGEATVD